MPPRQQTDSPNGKQQPMISSFFSKSKDPTAPAIGSGSRPLKRHSSPIDLTGDSDTTRPLKKAKIERQDSGVTVEKETKKLPAAIAPKPTGSSKAKKSGKVIVQKYRFVPPSSQDPTLTIPSAGADPPSPELQRKRETRRQAFRDKLLGPKNVLDWERENEDPFRGSGPPSDNERMDEDEEDTPLPAAAQALRKRFAASASTSNEAVPTDKGKSKGKKKVVELGPSGQSYTPLEKQILQLKEDYPDTILLVEVGYKYRFFGEDARVASKELGIACFPQRNFLSASIPVHRRPVHVKKLVSQGYKVGVVGQTETAALKKVGDNRSGPFTRKLQHLYTPATYIDELDSLDDDEAFGQTAARPLMCIVEELRGGMGVDERVLIGMISVVPSTGDIVYDEFEDGHMRTELETRITHIKPAELLLPVKGLSKTTEKMLNYLTGEAWTSSSGDRVRVERIAAMMDYTTAFKYASDFYTQKAEEHPHASENFRSGKLMAAVTDFPQKVIIALSHAIKHLAAFGLADAFLQTKFFAEFTTKAHMLLAGNTLSNLEIFRNQTDFTERGSLMWILDHTKTKFGSRMLHSWVGRPLVDVHLLNERIDAVEEILGTQGTVLDKLRISLRGLPDLVKGLCRVQYGKCSPKELALLLTAYEKISKVYSPFATPADVGFKSRLLNEVVFSLPTLHDPVRQLLETIDLRKARSEDNADLWLDPDKYPAIQDTKDCIAFVEAELQQHLHEIRKILKRPAATYVTVSAIEYLVEVRNTEAKKLVPAAWTRVSSTKAVTRFHTPDVKRMIQEREQYKEKLVAEAEKAYQAFLQEIAEEYDLFRDVTNKLALADCLLSLAVVANQQGYCRPKFVDDDRVDIVQGRHPMVEALTSDPFVPNTVTLGGSDPRSRIITGREKLMRSNGRFGDQAKVMAQIGSYVPADSLTLGLQEAVLTRMGASDELIKGRSTFMVELSETSDILKTASPRTLVILDELGRGTSTFDGMAIASAVLTHLVQDVKAKTLFITHYPLLAAELEKEFPEDLCNNHMGFIEEEKIDGTTDISFLYRLAPGMAKGSYGIECARLAGMPETILNSAQTRSASMKAMVQERTSISKLRHGIALLRRCCTKIGEKDRKEIWAF